MLNRTKENYRLRRKKALADLIEFGIEKKLAKGIVDSGKLEVVERIIQDTKKSKSQSPDKRFLKGLRYSRIKHGKLPLYRSLKQKRRDLE